MAGRGAVPKTAATRQRRNKPVAAARFETEERPRRSAPSLGKHPSGTAWHPRTRQWWRDVWSSPMAKEYLKADTDGLYQLATLIDAFWNAPTPQLAAEIRLQRQCYGLTPIDRRRLQWEIVRTEEAERKRPKPTPAPPPAGDPRAALRAV